MNDYHHVLAHLIANRVLNRRQFAVMFFGEGADMRRHVFHRSHEDEEADEEINAGRKETPNPQMIQFSSKSKSAFDVA